MASFDIIIKNGTLLDGVSDQEHLADVGISQGQIKAVGDLRNATAEKIIDAYGNFVSPGFIDIQNHSDSYLTLLEMPNLDSLVCQGITTIVVGHCGTSLAPLSGPDSVKSVQKWHSLAGANLNWQSFAEYYAALERYPLGVNVLSLLGHGTIRRGLIKDAVRAATPEEIQVMKKLVKSGLDAGAAGLSLGLVYAHEADATAEELEGVSRLAGDAGKMISVHLRSEGSHVVQALGEAIGLAEKIHARLKISHFKIRGAHNFGLLDEALATLDAAYQKGVDVFFDVYPYTTSWNVLYTYLPKWAYEGGRAGVLKNLKDKSARERILTYLRGLEEDIGSAFIASSPANPSLIGKKISQFAANQSVSAPEALLNVLEATQTQVVVFDQNLSEKVMLAMLKHPLSIISSDGTGYDFVYSAGQGLVHPRCFGTMPKFLELVRERGLMPWGEAIKKITSRPAEKIGLTNRGKILPGFSADIVIFNPTIVGSGATYENPYVRPDGIEYVLVNGNIAYESKKEEEVNPFGKVIKLK